MCLAVVTAAVVGTDTGTEDTAVITKVIIIGVVAGTLDHTDLVVGPRSWPIDSTPRANRRRSWVMRWMNCFASCARSAARP